MPDVVTLSGRAGIFECRVLYEPGDGAPLSPAEVERLRRFVSGRGKEWGARICSFLGLSPARDVTITLKPGIFLSMTRGTDVVIGVSAGTVSAGLAHELVHAIAGPSACQVYGEGLAVHVDSQLRLAGPAWPFFDLAPHRWVQLFVEEHTFVPLPELMAGPRVVPSDEEGISAAARFYLEAASLVGFAIDRLGIDGFWPHFRSGRQFDWADAGSIEAAWLAQLGGRVTDHERRARDAVAARLVDDGRHGVASSAPCRSAGRDV